MNDRAAIKTSTKILLVGGGYLAALVLAAVAVWIYAMLTAGPGRDASSGMYAFGDAVLFLGTFTLAALPATCVGLCALFAPTRFTRLAFLGAAATEAVVFVWVAFVWFQSIQ